MSYINLCFTYFAYLQLWHFVQLRVIVYFKAYCCFESCVKFAMHRLFIFLFSADVVTDYVQNRAVDDYNQVHCN